MQLLEFIWPLSVYRFLNIIERTDLERKILDCGAGGPRPPLALFRSRGFETHGIDISEAAIDASKKFASEQGINLNIIQGDMREIPFDDSSFSFVFSQNSICHLTKKDTMKTIKEMIRVLKPGGYMLVDFMSTESSYYGSPSLGDEVGQGEYLYTDDDGDEVLHSFHDDAEPDRYFVGLNIIRRVKTKSENLTRSFPDVDVRLDYYATKPI